MPQRPLLQRTRARLQNLFYSLDEALWPIEQRGDDFRTIISYRYQVGETNYRSETVSFGSSPVSGRAEAEAIFVRYPLGSTPLVAYHPNDSSLACLEPGALPADALSRVAIGGVLLLLGFWLVRGVGRA